MLEQKEKPASEAASASALRDEEGAIREDFVTSIAERDQERATAPSCATLAGDLHESDTGDLIEALDPDLRPQFIVLLGADFDFSALTEVDDTVREEILEELPSETVAEGVRELDSDDAVYILEDLPKDEQNEILEQLPASERVALERSLLYPEGSAGRRMQTEFIAVPPQRIGRRDHRFHARDAGSAGALLRNLRGRSVAEIPRRGAARPAACAPSVRSRSRA